MSRWCVFFSISREMCPKKHLRTYFTSFFFVFFGGQFSYDDYFTAVATTDILCNVADVLACKPSELAFYPIPKLMIRRVGDHEAYSALRASELGDGTLEVREVPRAVEYVRLFLGTDLIEVMCKSIEDNNKIGIYDGCKNAMRLALERAQSTQ